VPPGLWPPTAVGTGVTQPTGAAFDVVLLAHIGCVLVGLGAVVVSGVQGRRLLADPAGVSPSLRRYYRPGANWAGRALYGVPVFGFVLVAMSGGYYRLGDTWVLAGLVLFVGAAVVGEVVLWPAERDAQEELAEVRQPAGPLGRTTGGDPERLRRAARRVCVAALVVALVVLAATVLMVAQP
jgi:uncharacterized membrane protein